MIRLMRTMVVNFGVAGEFLHFLWKNKRWWLIPLVIILILFALLVMFASVSGIGPFIYPLF